MTPAEKVEILRACCSVSGADQNTDIAESQLLQKLAREIGVGQASLSAMIARSESDPEFYQEHFQILKSDPAKTIAMLVEVAICDGTLSDAEEKALRCMAGNLQIPADVVDQLLAAAQKGRP